MKNRDDIEFTEEDCCHNGCQNCVLNKYSLSLKKHEGSGIDKEKLRYDLLSQISFKPFVLVSVEPITFNTSLYVMKPHLKDVDSVHGFLPYSAGQHLSLCINKEYNKELYSKEKISKEFYIRSFTIISLSNEQDDCSFQLLIKLYENSVTSNFLKNLNIGDITYWKGPFGDYRHERNHYSFLIMICMGTGIAPMYPIIKEILSDEKDETYIKLLYGCKKSSEIILRNELRDLNCYWNFKCTYYLSEEKQRDVKKYNEEFIFSRITVDHISNVIQNKIRSFFLICGSSKFAEDMKENLKQLKVSPAQEKK